MRLRRRCPVLAALATSAVLVLAGCGGGGGGAPAAPAAAEPATSPAPTTTPAGTVVSAGGNGPEGIAVDAAGRAIIALRDVSGLALVDVAADGSTASVRQVVTGISQSARHIDLATPAGPALVPLEGTNELLTVDLGSGAVTSKGTGVGNGPHNAVRTADGTDVVTNEHGGGVVFVRDGQVLSSLPAGPPQPGGLAAVGRYAAVADVQGHGVFVYDGTTRTQVAQKAVGSLLTHALTLAAPGEGDGAGAAAGVVAFADTSGGAVELERITSVGAQVTVQDVARIDAPGSPYGLGYDAARSLLFVTLTATNQLRVVDVADPANPRVLGDLPTVRQPNSVAVDPRSGSVLVTGSAKGELQVIPRALLPTG